jgi:ABC-type multidrug transport system fused ATPase/permease subunit
LCVPVADRVLILGNGRLEKVLDPRHIESSTLKHLEKVSSVTVTADYEPHLKENSESKLMYQLVKSEDRKMGLSARKHLLSVLVTAGGLRIWGFILSSLIINEFLAIYHTAWTASWSSHENFHSDNYYAVGSFIITCGRGVMMFLSAALIIYAFTWQASTTMHRRLLSAFLAAPLQTLQTIPSGRLLNRFATDMEYFDLNLATLTQVSLRMFFSIVGRFISTTIQVPALLWVILAVLPILFSLQARLAKFLSDAKRLNAIWNSPLLTMINDSEHAVTVIRAFGAVEASAARMRLLQTQKRTAGLVEYSAWLLSR